MLQSKEKMLSPPQSKGRKRRADEIAAAEVTSAVRELGEASKGKLDQTSMAISTLANSQKRLGVDVQGLRR